MNPPEDKHTLLQRLCVFAEKLSEWDSRLDRVDNIVWEWAKMIIENPQNLRDGLDGVQQELQQANQSLFERLTIVEEQMKKYQEQLGRLLDLYLDGNFPKEALTERKTRLEELILNLGRAKRPSKPCKGSNPH